jgi:hypothetical protein
MQITNSMEMRPYWETSSYTEEFKNLPTFHRNWNVFTMLTRALHLSLSWARSKWMQIQEENLWEDIAEWRRFWHRLIWLDRYDILHVIMFHCTCRKLTTHFHLKLKLKVKLYGVCLFVICARILSVILSTITWLD